MIGQCGDTKKARQVRGLNAGTWRAGTLLLKCTARINGISEIWLKELADRESE